MWWLLDRMSLRYQARESFVIGIVPLSGDQLYEMINVVANMCLEYSP